MLVDPGAYSRLFREMEAGVRYQTFRPRRVAFNPIFSVLQRPELEVSLDESNMRFQQQFQSSGPADVDAAGPSIDHFPEFLVVRQFLELNMCRVEVEVGALSGRLLFCASCRANGPNKSAKPALRLRPYSTEDTR